MLTDQWLALYRPQAIIAGLDPLLFDLALEPLFLSASRKPPTLTLPLEGGGNCRFVSVVYASPLEGEVGA